MSEDKAVNLTFCQWVRVKSDDVSPWRSPPSPRTEIIDTEGVVFGVLPTAKRVKCYVYIPELDKTYGIGSKHLVPTGRHANIEDFAPQFAKHFFGLYSYGLIFPCSEQELYRHAKQRVPRFDRAYPVQARQLFCTFAAANLSMLIEESPYRLQNSETTIRRALELYTEITFNPPEAHGRGDGGGPQGR